MPAHKQQPPAKNSYSPQTIWKPLQSLQTCTGRRRAWWEQLPGLRLVHHIDSRCSYLSKSVGRGCCDGGVERQRVRSLREYSGWWILCFLAVTPTGFINSLVKTGKARCGLSAFWSKCTGGVLCMGIWILTAGLSWSLFFGAQAQSRAASQHVCLSFFFFF